MNATTSDYKRIGNRATPEVEKRWMSWTVLVGLGRKSSFVRPETGEIARRRKRGKAQRAARKINRGKR